MSHPNSKNNTLLRNNEVMYSNMMIKNIYKTKLEMEKNGIFNGEEDDETSDNKDNDNDDPTTTTASYRNFLNVKQAIVTSSATSLNTHTINAKSNRSQDLLHRAVLASENDKEVKYNANTLSRLNLENKKNDFALFKETKELPNKFTDSLRNINKIQCLPNVIIIENMDDANYFVQNAILQVISSFMKKYL